MKLRFVIDNLSEEDADHLDYKISDFLLSNDIKLVNFHSTTRSFGEYIEDVLSREEFTYSKEVINDNLMYFHKCWENGLSSYKALTFFCYKDDYDN